MTLSRSSIIAFRFAVSPLSFISLSSCTFDLISAISDLTVSDIFFNDSENIFSPNVVNITKPRGYNSWTGRKALSISCYLGYDNIFICGMDYDMLRDIKVTKDNKLYWTVKHCHDDKDRPSYVMEKSSFRTTGELLYFSHFDIIFHDKFKSLPIALWDPQAYGWMVFFIFKNCCIDFSHALDSNVIGFNRYLVSERKVHLDSSSRREQNFNLKEYIPYFED